MQTNLTKEFYRNHVKTKKLLENRNQMELIEDLFEMQKRFRETSNARDSHLPKIS